MQPWVWATANASGGPLGRLRCGRLELPTSQSESGAVAAAGVLSSGTRTVLTLAGQGTRKRSRSGDADPKANGADAKE